MATLELVTHCWAVRHPHFAQALCYQLSSLILDKPKLCDIAITVCNDPDDLLTTEVLSFFMPQLQIKSLVLGAPKLGRRSIGRNYAAKWSTADIVWFVDVDYVFREGCLDRLANMSWPNDASIIYPRTIKIQKDFAIGDKSLIASKPALCDVDPGDFVPHHYSRAIGGVQIVRGDFARQYGYLDGNVRWHKPVDKPFGDTREDVPYRKFCQRHGPMVAIDLPGVYRMRHSFGL